MNYNYKNPKNLFEEYCGGEGDGVVPQKSKIYFGNDSNDDDRRNGKEERKMIMTAMVRARRKRIYSPPTIPMKEMAMVRAMMMPNVIHETRFDSPVKKNNNNNMTTRQISPDTDEKLARSLKRVRSADKSAFKVQGWL